ncbi:hypothetical protein [Desulforudis sp. DRI-14]|uniref:hypothetical protein n=1 Tax=Desulforudis sp. DRI-14 TaxID=3459793 RepID=UPI004042397F
MNGRQVAGAAVVTVILIVSKILGFGREGALDGGAWASLFAGRIAGVLGGGRWGTSRRRA